MLIWVNELLTRIVLVFEGDGRAVCASSVTFENAFTAGVIPFLGVW
jgi:hypothetical protein